MKVKRSKKIILLLVALVSALLLVAATQAPQVRNRFKREFEPGTLPYRAQELKKQGITEHRIRLYPLWVVPLFDDFVDLMKGCDATVLATMVDHRYRLSGSAHSIETVAKFRVDEVLAGTLTTPGKAQVPAERLPAGARSMGPLRENEVLVTRPGGILTIDGVQFWQDHYEYPPFRPGRQYVLFLDPHQPVREYGNHYGGAELKIYHPVWGPFSVLVVGEDGPQATVKPLFQWSKMEAMLEFRWGSRKDFFVEYLRRMARGALELAGGQGKALS